MANDTGWAEPEELAAFRECSLVTNLLGRVWFVARDRSHGEELWVLQGATNEPVRVKDINRGRGDARITGLMAFKGALFFLAGRRESDGLDLWRSDGTADGTVRLRDLDRFPHDVEQVTCHEIAGDTLYFTDGSVIWRTRGDADSTERVKDLHLRDDGGVVHMVDFRGMLFVAAARRVWRSDGTAAGTERLDTLMGPITAMDVFGGRLYVAAARLHVLDAPDAEELAQLQIHTLSEVTSSPETFLDVDGRHLLFTASDGEHGRELWRTDGTPEGTQLLKDIRAGAQGSRPAEFRHVGRYWLFLADDGRHGEQLWRTDGTAEGTVMVRPLAEGRRGLTVLNACLTPGRLYLNVKGAGLHVTDGTAEGTVRLLPLGNDAAARGLGPFGACQDRIVFLYDNGLWGSDGTAAGTGPLSDGRFSLNPNMMATFQDGVVFCGAGSARAAAAERRVSVWRVRLKSGTE